ncbi:MAG: division/cell wall cluster transcriptional repressor MraZ [Flammeovirgaceae bacterium]|nr:division/cell wall cluster transcriptional repressor MraZ [Flammeovirgaceae bacterium]
MSYFSSEFECKLDAKGRLVLPSRVKSDLPEDSENKIVIKRGFEPCLTIYPYVEWMKIFNKVAKLNEFNPEDRKFQRIFLRGNTEIELDKTGRFVIPKSMLRYAKLEKEVLLIGLGKRVEIWNPEVYDEFLFGDQNEYSLLAQKYLGNWEDNEEKDAEIVEVTEKVEAEAEAEDKEENKEE